MFQIPRELSVVTYLRHSSDWRELWAEMSKAYRIETLCDTKVSPKQSQRLISILPGVSGAYRTSQRRIGVPPPGEIFDL